MHEIAAVITQQLHAVANPDKARWLENYVKHDIRSLGVGIPDVRKVVKTVTQERALDQTDFAEQKQWLDQLMQGRYTETKLAAIIYVQLYGKTVDSADILALTGHWFDQHWISDWNVCDWLCVRLLSPVIDRDAALAVDTWSDWNQDSYLWKARASLVPFAQCKTLDQHAATVLSFSRTLIQREERFSKTAVGWVLREYSKIDADLVTGFLDRYAAYTTNEVVKNATKYL